MLSLLTATTNIRIAKKTNFNSISQRVRSTYWLHPRSFLRCIWLSWLVDWMVFYAAFKSISVISRQQLSLLMPFLGFTILVWRSEVFSAKISPGKTQRIQCDSNPGPLDYESNTLPRSTPIWISQPEKDWFGKKKDIKLCVTEKFKGCPHFRPESTTVLSSKAAKVRNAFIIRSNIYVQPCTWWVWLIVWCWTLSPTSFQWYRSDKCTIHTFLEFLFTCPTYNILFSNHCLLPHITIV